MAVVRARSAPPYALIIFVFLTVIAVGFAIYLGVQKGAAETGADQANAKALDASNQLKAANSQMNAMRAVITEAPGSNPQAVGAAKDALKAAGITEGSMSQGIAKLAQEVKDLESQKAALEEQMKNIGTQNTQTASAAKTAADSSQKSIADLTQQLTQATNQTAQSEKDKEDQAKAAQDTLTKQKSDDEQKLREITLKYNDALAQIKQKDQQIHILTESLQGQKVSDIAMAPAGHVVRAAAGTGECYIDLGAKDKIVRGLTFSVHDPRVGVRGKPNAPNESQDASDAGDVLAAGKGAIEVLEVGATESLCRIEHTAMNQSIQPGDLIANPVYQANVKRKHHFVVIGDFDLDGDGTATAGERERVLQMITAWGGIVDKEVTPQVDFVIAGTPPAEPANTSDDQKGSVTDAQSSRVKNYNDSIIEAKQDGVTILNVNRFLAMIGYYDTSIVR